MVRAKKDLNDDVNMCTYIMLHGEDIALDLAMNGQSTEGMSEPEDLIHMHI